MVGQNIGKYRVLDRIGRGGMGTVYRAIDETLHREVAIKVLNAELNDPEIARRFRAEAITVARLNHPGIATIYELLQHDGQWLMVMEFVRGETLERLVERSGPIPPGRTAELCMQALAALAHAHSMGVVHRDLKPANVMTTETGVIKIMDFGIARVAGTEHLTNVGFMMGTPAYMAPEQVLGHEIDARADLYAIGVVFYRLVAGKLPFKGDTPFAMAQSQVNDPPAAIGTVRADLPPWVEPLLTRALAKAPDDRFQSAIEFHEALARCLEGLPMAAPYSSSAPTEMIRTPSRALRTGTLDRSTANPTLDSALDLTPPSQSLARPAPELEPTVLAPTPIATRTMTAAAAATVRTPTRELQAEPERIPGAEPDLVPEASPAAELPRERTAAPVGETATPPKQRPTAAIAVAAVVIVLAGGAAAWFFSRRAPAPAEPSGVASTAPPAPEVPPAAPASDPSPSVAAPLAPAPPAATPEGSSAAAPVPSPKAPVRASRSTAAPTDVAPPVVAEAPIAFGDVKLLMVTERNNTSDQDVTLRFADGQLAALAKKTGTTLGALPYTGIVRVTYLKARDPKWDPAVFGPPSNLDVGGMLRTSKHWLVVQGTGAYLILRLEDSNWRRVLESVKTRTGVDVALPASADKP